MRGSKPVASVRWFTFSPPVPVTSAEFMTLTGDTVAVVTLRPAQIRSVQSRDGELAATGS